MGQRPRRLDALLLVGDRGRFHGPDPDRQIAVAVDLFEQHDRLVAGQLHPNPDHAQLAHRSPLVPSETTTLHATRARRRSRHRTYDPSLRHHRASGSACRCDAASRPERVAQSDPYERGVQLLRQRGQLLHDLGRPGPRGRRRRPLASGASSAANMPDLAVGARPGTHADAVAPGRRSRTRPRPPRRRARPRRTSRGFARRADRRLELGQHVVGQPGPLQDLDRLNLVRRPSRDGAAAAGSTDRRRRRRSAEAGRAPRIDRRPTVPAGRTPSPRLASVSPRSIAASWSRITRSGRKRSRCAASTYRSRCDVRVGCTCGSRPASAAVRPGPRLPGSAAWRS